MVERTERVEQLLNFTRALISGKPGNPLIDKYKSYIDTVNHTETMVVLDILIKEGMPVETVKEWVPKILNVFYNSLISYEWEPPSKEHFLYYLMEENRELDKILDEIKGISKEAFKNDDVELFGKLRELLTGLVTYELHYIKKENILFPYIEKAFEGHRCLSVMWSFHDDYRAGLKVLDNLLEEPLKNKQKISREIGKLFFVLKPIIFREEQIVFPVALNAISQKDWDEMLNQSHNVGWCYITPPSQKSSNAKDGEAILHSDIIDLETGLLVPNQIKWILNTIPVDMTYIDENDEVKFFSDGEHKIFHRSKAVIGRTVQNCHPPESVYMVEEILDAFKSGKRNVADFWITMKGRFVYIRYFAVRDENGEYKGTLEVSQDITDIKKLEGQKRLLDWE